jgi:flavin reductase (DIM6/NTAB) family NADH-FMN oxidoreductase RutF
MTIQPPDAGRDSFVTIEPKILYFGTPVAVVSSANEDGTTNLAPISSFWALGWTIVLGLLRDTKTLQNLEQNPDCVVNLPSPDLWRQVELLAPVTGLNPVPKEKAPKFRYERDKFTVAGLTPVSSEIVSVPRVKECPRPTGSEGPKDSLSRWGRAPPATNWRGCGRGGGAAGSRTRGLRDERALRRSRELAAPHLQLPPLLWAGTGTGKDVSCGGITRERLLPAGGREHPGVE